MHISLDHAHPHSLSLFCSHGVSSCFGRELVCVGHVRVKQEKSGAESTLVGCCLLVFPGRSAELGE